MFQDSSNLDPCDPPFVKLTDRHQRLKNNLKTTENKISITKIIFAQALPKRPNTLNLDSPIRSLGEKEAIMKKLELAEFKVTSFITKVRQDQIRGGDFAIGDTNELYEQSIIGVTDPTSYPKTGIGPGTGPCC